MFSRIVAFCTHDSCAAYATPPERGRLYHDLALEGMKCISPKILYQIKIKIKILARIFTDLTTPSTWTFFHSRCTLRVEPSWKSRGSPSSRKFLRRANYQIDTVSFEQNFFVDLKFESSGCWCQRAILHCGPRKCCTSKSKLVCVIFVDSDRSQRLAVGGTELI